MIEEELRVVVDCAALAPSVHNSQPWSFSSDGDVVEIRVDPSRQLSYLDPTGRQMSLSCGAAVEFARLAVRALGRECRVQILPDPTVPALVARLIVGAPVVTTRQEQLLVDAIPRRYTDRGPYEARPVPAAALADAQTAAADLGVWMRVVDRADDRLAVTLLLADAESAEAADPGYAEELSRWTHAGSAPDGMPASALGRDWPADRVTDLPLRDFTGHAGHPRPADFDGPPPQVGHDTVILIGTASDTRSDWVTAGRALGWLVLRLAADGVATQPLGPAIDLPHARARLQHDLGLVGSPQFLLRAGYGVGRPHTSRRNPVEVVSRS